MLFGIAVSLSSDAISLRVCVADEGVNKPSQNATKSSLVSLEDVEKALELPCPEIPIDGTARLADLLKIIGQHLSATAGHPVPFLADHVELEREALTTIDEYEVRITKIHAGTHTCFDLLQLFLEQAVDPAELAIVPRPGHILITTLAKAESGDFFKPRVYDLSDLLIPHINENGARVTSKDDGSAPLTGTQHVDDADNNISGFHDAGDWELPGKYGWTISSEMETLLNIVYCQTAPPARWWNVDGEGGNMSIYGQYVVVIQTYYVHHKITQLLSDLRATKSP